MNKLLATLLLLLVGAPAGAADLQKLRGEMRAARVAQPSPFVALDTIRARVIASPPPYDRKNTIARQMIALGADALYALLSLVEPGAPELAAATPRVRSMIRASAVEAVIQLKDRRAVPLMQQLVEEEDDFDVQRGAAEAIGVLEAREDALFLIARAQSGAKTDRAAIAGLSLCRRPEVAAHLAARLGAHPDDATAAAIADAIGFHGSSWAWEALGAARAQEGAAARQKLADALLSAYPGYQGRARSAIGNALIVVEHPATPNALAAMRARADQSLAADLQTLETRFIRLARPAR